MVFLTYGQQGIKMYVVVRELTPIGVCETLTGWLLYKEDLINTMVGVGWEVEVEEQLKVVFLRFVKGEWPERAGFYAHHTKRLG